MDLLPFPCTRAIYPYGYTTRFAGPVSPWRECGLAPAPRAEPQVRAEASVREVPSLEGPATDSSGCLPPGRGARVPAAGIACARALPPAGVRAWSARLRRRLGAGAGPAAWPGSCHRGGRPGYGSSQVAAGGFAGGAHGAHGTGRPRDQPGGAGRAFVRRRRGAVGREPGTGSHRGADPVGEHRPRLPERLGPAARRSGRRPGLRAGRVAADAVVRPRQAGQDRPAPGPPAGPGRARQLAHRGHAQRQNGPLWRTFLAEQRALVGELDDVVPVLPSVTAPVLLLADPQDTLIPVDTARRLEQALPDARLQLVDGVGHDLPRRRRSDGRRGDGHFIGHRRRARRLLACGRGPAAGGGWLARPAPAAVAARAAQAMPHAVSAGPRSPVRRPAWTAAG